MIRTTQASKASPQGFSVTGQKVSQQATNTAKPKVTTTPATSSTAKSVSSTKTTKSTTFTGSKLQNSAESKQSAKPMKGMLGFGAARMNMDALISEYEEIEKGDFCECKELKPEPKPRPIGSEQPTQTQPKPVEVITPIQSTNPASMIKKLKWSDFKGEPPGNSCWLAYTFWNYSYSYKPVPTADPSKLKIQLQAKCDLNPKSWVRSKHDDLLSHEQGHYDIACLCMLNFKKRVVETEFDKNNYKNEIVEIYKEVVKEFRAKQIQYDEETAHYCNEAEQARWDKQIYEDLKALSVYEFMEITKSK